MSRRYLVFRPLDHVVSISTYNSPSESPEKIGLYPWLVKGIPRFSRPGRVLLLALACSLALLTSAKSASASQGSGRRPQLTLSTSTLNFGSVVVNSSAKASVTLTSSGTSAVTVNSASMAGAGFTIAGTTLPVTLNSNQLLTLNPGQSVTLQLQFLPTVAGAATGKLTIGSNSTTGSIASVALTGTGTAGATSPQLTLSASSLNFGSVTVNSSAKASVTLTSSGTSAVTVNSASITGAGFTIVAGTLPVTLSPNQSTTLQLQFLPTAAGAASGQLIISSNSTSGSTATVALAGTGVAGANPQLSLSASTLSFGSVTVNSSAKASVTLTSSGTSALTVNSASITGTGFTLVAGSFPVTLSPSQSVTLQVQFLPTAAGTATGQLTISSTSTSGSTATVSLSGTGVAANPKLTVSTTSLSFGSVSLNTSSTKSVTLTSSGTSPVTVNAASITGAGFTTVGGSFPLTLNPQQTAAVQVQFLPTAAGAVTGQLTISNNSTGGSAVVALSGTGTSVAHYVDLSWSAPTGSTDPVAGYNIYRSLNGGTAQLLNSTPITTTTYVDNSVVAGSTYTYTAASVDASGVQSTPSNQIQVTIPSP
jgi:hypothetical protein